MDAETKENLEKSFSPKEVSQIEKFLDRGFSLNGQIVIASIFLYAKDQGLDVAEVLAECQKEWQKNWQHQRSDIRGDIDTPGVVGYNNRISVVNICHVLAIPLLSRIVEVETPARSITVTTKPINCTWCRIAMLSRGYRMRFVALDGSEIYTEWTTSSV